MLLLIERVYVPVTLMLLALISYLSLLPLDALPQVSGTDKLHHFIAYAALAIPVAVVRPKSWLRYIFGFFLYSGLIEVIQPSVNRHCDWLDLIANSCGLLLGVVLATGLRRVIVS